MKNFYSHPVKTLELQIMRTYWEVLDKNLEVLDTIIVEVATIPNTNMWLYNGKIREIKDIPCIYLEQYIDDAKEQTVRNKTNQVLHVKKMVEEEI